MYRQLFSQSWDHKANAFIMFINIKKACDSVPQTAMWTGFRKLAVPKQTITLFQSFDENMQARIHQDGTLLEEINVDNRLREGRVADVLFNLHAYLIVE